jgi:hypothetical protein
LQKIKRKHLLILNYFSYFFILHLASGGYIIMISPRAIGQDIVPVLNAPTDFAKSGNKQPPKTPTIIAIKIHRVKNLSRKDNFILLYFPN